MTLPEFLRDIERVYKRGRDNTKELKGCLPSEDNFEFVTNYLTTLYSGDDYAREYINTNNIHELAEYLRYIEQQMRDDYSAVLSSISWKEGFLGAVDKKDFNDIYRCMKEKKEYYETHALSELAKDQYFNIKEYKNWQNILNNYYDSVMKGDFSGLLNQYKILHSMSYVIGVVELYDFARDAFQIEQIEKTSKSK